jgi:hypothetical protein
MRRHVARRISTGAGLAATFACVALAAGCVPARTSSTAATSGAAANAAVARTLTIDNSLAKGALTPEGNDVYNLSRSGTVVTASAPAGNRGSNTRLGFWRAPDQDSADQQTCSTWTQAPDGLQQQGAVLRVRSTQARTTAITVTQNIYYGAWWVFNVHVMDSAAAQPFHQIGTFDLGGVFRSGDPEAPETLGSPDYPWRMCARAVGNVVSFMVWPLSDPRPAWNDTRYGGSVRLPAGWSTAGDAGWYVGHLEPGRSSSFGDMSILGLVPDATPAARQAAAAALAAPSSAPRDPTWIAEAP